jgi:hypothetical protein
VPARSLISRTIFVSTISGIPPEYRRAKRKKFRSLSGAYATRPLEPAAGLRRRRPARDDRQNTSCSGTTTPEHSTRLPTTPRGPALVSRSARRGAPIVQGRCGEGRLSRGRQARALTPARRQGKLAECEFDGKILEKADSAKESQTAHRSTKARRI